MSAIGRRIASARVTPPIWRGAVGIVILLVIIEAFTRSGIINPAFLPPASTVLARAGGLLIDPVFLGHIASTMQAWALGLGLAIAVAVPAGVVLGSSEAVYRASYVLVEFLRPIPSVALIPLAILLFGQGTQMKMSLIVYASVWPILFNTITGIHSVDPLAKDTARSFGFSRLAVLGRVSLPSALPFIFTGIRVAAAIALILAISAELLAGGANGVGTYILRVQQANQPALVYAGTVITGVLGFLINLLLVRLEHRYLGWQPALREGAR